MIGNISLGISLENGRSRVPIPPAVMSAAYPRIPFCPDASRLDPECSLPTRYCPNGVEERAAYVNVMFSTWVQSWIDAAIGAHSNTRGICDDLACFALKGAMGGGRSPGHFSSSFRSRDIIRGENGGSDPDHRWKWIHRQPFGGEARGVGPFRHPLRCAFQRQHDVVARSEDSR